MIVSMIEVLVLEPDPLWRALIARALGREESLDVGPPVETSAAALARLDAGAAPGVAVIAADCTDVCTRLVDDGVGVVLLYEEADAESAVDALGRGARGCIARAASAAELSATVLAVARGETSYACLK